MFSVYSELICDITRKNGINIHTYADDTQLYLSFDASDDIAECLNKTEECVGEKKEWMMKNMLKLNHEKTEVLVISIPYFTDKLKETNLRVGDASVLASESARNLGVMFDNTLNMSHHIKTVCRASFRHLRHLISI